MPVPPSVTDWAWLGRQPLEDIARRATQASEPATWLKQAYAWIYSRLDVPLRESLPPAVGESRGPAAGMVPLLGAMPDGTGCLGFLSIRFESVASASPVGDIENTVYEAATAVGEIFQRLDPTVGQPHWNLDACKGGGRSVGLSTVVASVINLLSLTARDDFAATGCYDRQNGLHPVPPETLPAKLEAARRWGYRSVLVVEGQTGIPLDSPLRFVEIPRNLPYAFFAIVGEIAALPGEQAVARLLAVFDQSVVRAEPRDQDLDRTLAMTRDFISPHTPALVRHVAHDIRGRALLHAGQTAEAAAERELADSLRPGALEFPSGWLGEYLKWHQVAHHAVLALDQGRWDDDEPEHRQLDRTLDRLLDAIDDRRAGREELLAALFLSNTRARRLDFLGRWHRDASLLRRAWIEVTRFLPHWEPLFEYCHEIGLRDSDLRRQQNNCLDILASHWHLEGHLPPTWLETASTFWPSDAELEVDHLGPFDLPYYLRWKVLSGQQIDEAVVAQALEAGGRMFEEKRGNYPFFLVFEAILRYRLGSKAQRQEAANRLATSCLFSPELPPTSILTLLALRAEQLLKEIEVSQVVASRPAPGNPLADQAFGLLSRPDVLVDRCPY